MRHVRPLAVWIVVALLVIWWGTGPYTSGKQAIFVAALVGLAVWVWSRWSSLRR